MKITIAIDGHAGCGKSTTAKKVAKLLNYLYIDSGAMYRAVTHYFLQNQVLWENPDAVETALAQIKISFEMGAEGKQATFLNGKNVEKYIRTLQVSDKVSEISSIVAVRNFLVKQQRSMGENKGIVMDGRDIGTVVFPEAELKIFMTADLKTRALRRQKELAKKEDHIELDVIIENLRSRDYLDAIRKEGSLKKAADAIVINTTALSIKAQTKKVLQLSRACIAKNSLNTTI